MVALASEKWNHADEGLHHVKVILPLAEIPVRIAEVACKAQVSAW